MIIILSGVRFAYICVAAVMFIAWFCLLLAANYASAGTSRRMYSLKSMCYEVEILTNNSVRDVVVELQKFETTEYLDVYSLHVRSDIQLRFATTLVTSRVANRANFSNEAVFSVTLPDEAFISNFTMEIDGVVYPGVVDEKAKAKKKFDRAKKKGKSTGLVSNWPPESNQFVVQVNVAAMSKVTFNLTYQELLKRTLGAYQHKILIDPKQPVGDLKVEVAIQETRDITKLHVPPIQKFSRVRTVSSSNNAFAVITRPTSRSAYITYSPTLDAQRAVGENGISGYFVVEYDVERGLDAGDVLVTNGYFVHFIAPDIENRIPTDVVFVLDMSGSMGSKKLTQLKKAMVYILGQLSEVDRFNIIKFSGSTNQFTLNMNDVTQTKIKRAIKYVNRIRASGSTNIDVALHDAIHHLRQNAEDLGRSPIMVFLTDGMPSAGEINKQNILSNVIDLNEGEISIFTLAFGNDADWNLVKTLALQNGGFGRKIYEDSDADLQISGFYDEVSVTLLNNLTVKYPDTVDSESITQSTFKNVFKGSEIVIAGKLEDANIRTLDAEIFAESAIDSIVLTTNKDDILAGFDNVTGLMEISDIGEIAEKLWAYLTIKQLLDNTVREMNTSRRAEYKKKALELSLKYGFVTPLTSMVVVRPEDEDEDEEDYTTTTLPPTTTRAPYRYRGGGGYSGGGGGDPHYMVRLGGIQHPLCFDVRGTEGEIHNLITDPSNDITVNTLLVGDPATLDKDGNPKTFIGQVSVQLSHHVIVVTPDAVIFDTKVYEWSQERIKHFGNSKLLFTEHGRTLSIQLGVGSEIIIRRHMHNNPDIDHVNYLNVYVFDEEYFSKHTVGLIGQFVNGHKHITLKKELVNDSGVLVAKFQVKERLGGASSNETEATRHRIRAKLVERSEIVTQGTQHCWMIQKQFEDLLLGDRKRYVTKEFIKNL